MHKYHPDKHVVKSDRERKELTEITTRINLATESLINLLIEFPNYSPKAAAGSSASGGSANFGAGKSPFSWSDFFNADLTRAARASRQRSGVNSRDVVDADYYGAGFFNGTIFEHVTDRNPNVSRFIYILEGVGDSIRHHDLILSIDRLRFPEIEVTVIERGIEGDAAPALVETLTATYTRGGHGGG